MKKLLFVFMGLGFVTLSGCNSTLNQYPNFTVYDLEMQRDVDYILDKTANVVYISGKNNQSDYTLKITPPTELKDLSEVMIWCNDIPFANNQMFFSNGKDVYITLPKGNRTFTKISIRWKINSKKQDYFVTYE